MMLGAILAIGILGNMKMAEPPVSDQTEQSDSKETVVSERLVEGVQSAPQASVERNSYLIETLPEIKEIEIIDFKEFTFLPSPAKVFEVLFEHILSPNSPWIRIS